VPKKLKIAADNVKCLQSDELILLIFIKIIFSLKEKY
jgi:hypothetical protein